MGIHSLCRSDSIGYEVRLGANALVLTQGVNWVNRHPESSLPVGKEDRLFTDRSPAIWR